CMPGRVEAWVPCSHAGFRYIREANRANVRDINITHVNNTVVVNNQRNEIVNTFANHRFATVVPADQFGQTRRVRDVAVRNVSVTTAAASLPVSHAPAVTAPRTAAGVNATNNRSAQFNRTGRPPLPHAGAAGGHPGRTGTAFGTNAAPTRTVTGHPPPALPPARSNATAGANAPSRLGATTRTPTVNAGRGLPPLPS